MSLFNYSWDFSFVTSYIPLLIKGFYITIVLSLLTIIFSTILGIIIGIVMSRKDKYIKYTSIFFVDIIRSIPTIVLILLVYYLYPIVGLKGVSPFWPALTALIINNSAFIGDIFRGSIEGLPKGSYIAAKSLGMNQYSILKRIILPEMYRETFPSIVFSYLAIIRVTSLASIITVYELTHIGDWIISLTYHPLEVYVLISLMYLVIILPLTLIARKLEKISYFKRRSI
jgi:polar amino acid transport system permease protein